jgi:hypothetical protein
MPFERTTRSEEAGVQFPVSELSFVPGQARKSILFVLAMRSLILEKTFAVAFSCAIGTRDN